MLTVMYVHATRGLQEQLLGPALPSINSTPSIAALTLLAFQVTRKAYACRRCRRDGEGGCCTASHILHQSHHRSWAHTPADCQGGQLQGCTGILLFPGWFDQA